METSSSPLYGSTAKHRSQLQIWAAAIWLYGLLRESW